MKPINIFIAYSRQDTPYLQQLRVYLRPISRNKNIHIWYDGEIVPGTKWEESVKKHLYAADIILLMMSADALNSDFFYETEMRRALEQHESGKSIVIPIILSHCLWDEPELKLVDLQALPQDAKPIKDWIHESKAYDNIARGVSRSIKLIVEKRREETEGQRGGATEKKRNKKKEANSLATLKGEQEKNLNKEPSQAKKHQNSTGNSRFSITVIGVVVLTLVFILLSRYFTGMSKEEKATHIQKLIEDMVSIKGSTFTMGCLGGRDGICGYDEITYKVTLSDFKIGKFEVTQGQWEAIMGENPSYFKNCSNCPVEDVSWNDAQDFIQKLKQETGFSFRLPTEAEWEFAARGGMQSKKYKYAGSNDLSQVAWYGKNSKNKTHIVGEKNANELGLFDMSGNVWEWCEDGYENYSGSPKVNPKEPNTEASPVLRGGSWFSTTTSVCRVVLRSFNLPTYRTAYVGFRLAK